MKSLLDAVDPIKTKKKTTKNAILQKTKHTLELKNTVYSHGAQMYSPFTAMLMILNSMCPDDTEKIDLLFTCILNIKAWMSQIF